MPSPTAMSLIGSPTFHGCHEPGRGELSNQNRSYTAPGFFQNSTLSDRFLLNAWPMKPLATSPLFANVHPTGKQEPTRLRPAAIGIERLAFDTRPQNIRSSRHACR